MTKEITLALKDLIPIKEIKEDINLALFNSPSFSFDDMKITNQIMEAIQDVKIQIRIP